MIEYGGVWYNEVNFGNVWYKKVHFGGVWYNVPNLQVQLWCRVSNRHLSPATQLTALHRY